MVMVTIFLYFEQKFCIFEKKKSIKASEMRSDGENWILRDYNAKDNFFTGSTGIRGHGRKEKDSLKFKGSIERRTKNRK